MRREFTIQYKDRHIFCIQVMPEGNEKVPLVIFCHGYNGSSEGFKYQQEFLEKKGIGSIAFDFCGGSVNAKSTLETTDMTIDTEVEDLLAVYDSAIEIERTDASSVFFHGESQGGLVSALAAAKLGDKLRGLILIYPALCIPDNWNTRYANVEDIPEVEEFWGMRLGKNFFMSIRDMDVYNEISKYKGKVIIIHGENDEVVPVSYSEKAASCYEDALLEVFPNEGHGFTHESVEREMIYAYVKEFIKK